MPIEIGLWKVNNLEVEKVEFSQIDTESRLEDILVEDISILSDSILLIGRQIRTKQAKYIDMLGIDIEGNLVIIELKKGKTPREVVAQTLDYASWVQNLSYQYIRELYEEHNEEESIEEAFYEYFDENIPDKINEAHSIIIVATELDKETERIINYLSNSYNVPINAVFFRYFKDGKNEYMCRSWLIDPNVAEDRISKNPSNSKSEQWNGNDFVVNFDDREFRSWDDARKYGFVSGGQGRWYSRTLNQLFPGARIFCMRPRIGYIGVGTVRTRALPIKDFYVEVDGKEELILNLPLTATAMDSKCDDLELCEYVVGIDWIKTVDIDEAFWVKGLKANQNTAFKLKSQFTIERLEEFFNINQ